MVASRIALLMAALALPGLPSAVHAAPVEGVALVIGNGTYPGQPPLQACLSSAHALAAALRSLHFTVVEREDASAGEMDAALSAFTAAVQQQAGPPSVIYACGYGSGFNQRSFLLPVSAQIARPADVLTQGVLTRSVLATVGLAKAGPSLAVLDVAPLPGQGGDLGLAGLIQADLPPQLGLLAAAETPAGITPTPVADALVNALQAPPPVAVQAVLLAVNGAASGQPAVHVAALHAPATPEVLIAAPAPPVSAKARPRPVQPAAQAPAPQPQPPPATPQPATAPQPGVTAGPVTLPAEDHMTDSDRRQVQSALARLGYYDGKIDGIFGPDTRAAIRRWQFELHAPMTGSLTAAEANRLVGP